MTNECSLQAQARWPTSSVLEEIFPKLHLHSHLLPGICSLAKYRNSITLLPEARSHPKLPGEQPLPTRCQMVFKGVQTGVGRWFSWKGTCYASVGLNLDPQHTSKSNMSGCTCNPRTGEVEAHPPVTLVEVASSRFRGSHPA